jgi:hypothetical protein
VIRDGGLPSRRAPAKAPEADGREPRRRRRRNLVSYRFLLYLCLLKPIARTLTCSRPTRLNLPDSHRPAHGWGQGPVITIRRGGRTRVA